MGSIIAGTGLPSLVSRLEEGVGTHRGALAVIVLALIQFGIVSVALPVIPGRDFGDYLWFWVQMGAAHSVFPMSMLFRVPVAPLVIGAPLDLTGSWGLSVVMALLFAFSVLAWVRTALTFGNRAALVAAAALLVFPGYTILFHEPSSNPVFAATYALLALLLVRAVIRPSATRFALVGLGIAVAALTRPETQVLLVLAAVPLTLALRWSRRLAYAAIVIAAAAFVLAGWAVNNGVRYGDYTLARRGLAYLPFFRAFTTDHIVSGTNGPASRKLAQEVQSDLLPLQPYRAYRVTVRSFFTAGKDREFADLLSLSDRLAWASNYSLLRRAGLEAVRAHPGTYVRGVARTLLDEFWLPLYVALPATTPKESSSAMPATGSRLPKPSEGELVPSSNQGAYLATSDNHIREIWTSPTEHHLVFATAAQKRAYDRVQSDSARLTAKLPAYSGDAFIVRQLSRASRIFPPGLIWLAAGLVGLAIRRPTRTGVALWLIASALTVALVEALSDYTIIDFAVPLLPAFIVLAAAGVVGSRGNSAPHAPRTS